MKAAQGAPGVRYQVAVQSTHAHLFSVTLTIAAPSDMQVVSLPVWIPGSYLIREFSKNLQGLRATQSERTCALTPLDKCSWQVDCTADSELTLRYEVYAFDSSVRTAFLDATRGFFNGTSVLLRVHGLERHPHQLTLLSEGLPARWHAATALTPRKVSARGFGTYLADDYDALVDAPVELGSFWEGTFDACGVAHRVIVAGAAAGFDSKRLLADIKAICQTEIHFWHGKRVTPANRPVHDNYLFMINAVDNGYGGLEHCNSTALICKRADLPHLGLSATLQSTDGYTTLLGLISHEYFHTWNVKRLRPAEFSRYDYTQENYTELLWFFEGFTSYYDDLLLHRAGLINSETYLRLLGKTVNQVQQTPGRHLQSVAQASHDAWVKYYRQDENTVNATISYYTKGALIALCLDLTLRQSDHSSLDAVMRNLWQRCKAGPMSEHDVLAVLHQVSGESFEQRLAHWVHSTTDLPVQALLQQQGVHCTEEPAPLPTRLGLRVEEQGSIRIKHVLREGAAEQAGFAAGDEWLGIEVGHGNAAQGWRLTRLDDLPHLLGAETHFKALVARDGRLLWLAGKLPAQTTVLTLAPEVSGALDTWLAGT